MSHFTVAVLIPAETDPAAIEDTVGRPLAPYDENTRVEPYPEPCSCARAGTPDAACEDCAGTGTAQSTYNPLSKWDWWEIGGRWSGAINGSDVAPVRTLPEGYSTFALVTPEGEWFQRGRMGWWAMVSDAKEPDRWAAEFTEILSSHPEALVVQIDCHI